MPGPPPKDPAQRRRRNKPTREWTATPGVGWQHGEEIPAPPDGLKEASVVAWKVWFASWFGAHWTPDDLPGLRQLIQLYDVVERGGIKAADRSQLIRWMDAYGITPRGQSLLRWAPPKAAEPTEGEITQPEAKAGPYGHLRVVNA